MQCSTFSILLKWYIRISLLAFLVQFASLVFYAVHVLHVLSPNLTCQITSLNIINVCCLCCYAGRKSLSSGCEKVVDKEEEEEEDRRRRYFFVLRCRYIT